MTLPGETFVSHVKKGESDAGGVGNDDGPVPLVVSDGAAVKSVSPIILVLRDVRGHAVDGESAVLDAICITANDGAEIGVDRVCIIDVLRGSIVTENHILRLAVLVVDIKVRQSRAVIYKGRVDSRSADCIFLINKACAAVCA